MQKNTTFQGWLNLNGYIFISYDLGSQIEAQNWQIKRGASRFRQAYQRADLKRERIWYESA